MLGILLLILKIIGIVLLCILGLLVLLILILLFAPVHYCIKADYYTQLHADMRITWLLRLASGKLKYQDGKLNIKVKALWKTLYDNQKEPEEYSDSDKEYKKKKNKKAQKEKNIFDEDSSKHITKDYFDDNEIETNGKEDADKEKPDKEKPDKEKIDQKSSSKHTKKKKFYEKLIEKLSAILKKIISFFKAVVKSIQDVAHKVENAKEKMSEKIAQISEAVNNPDNKELVHFIKIQLGKLLRIIKPKKFRLNCHFGFDDPEMTGNIAIWLAMLYGFLGMDINIRPDFEKEVYEGDVYIKGYIQLYGIVIIAIRCYTNKQIRKLINK